MSPAAEKALVPINVLGTHGHRFWAFSGITGAQADANDDRQAGKSKQTPQGKVGAVLPVVSPTKRAAFHRS